MKKLLFSFLIVFTLSACGAPVTSKDAAGASVITVRSECVFYEPDRLSYLTENALPDSALSGIRTAVVPHYAQEMDMLCQVLASIDHEPETFVIVAPDHPASGTVTVSCSDWYWEDHEMYCDRDLIGSISEKLGIDISSAPDAEEWSAATLLPYIDHYFPNAEVVIIYVSRAASPSTLSKMADFLSAFDKDEVFLLCSADFSHYQAERDAVANDKYTRSVIENMDAGALLRLGNEYLDSPQAVSVAIKYAAALELKLTQYDSVVLPYYENGILLAGSYHCYVAVDK